MLSIHALTHYITVNFPHVDSATDITLPASVVDVLSLLDHQMWIFVEYLAKMAEV